MAVETIAPPLPVDATRNGFLRTATVGAFGKTADVIHVKTPGVTPDHVTLVGLGLHLAGTVLGERERRRALPRKGVLLVACALKGIGYAADGVDGNLARKKQSHNRERGELLDIGVDRVEEAIAAEGRARTADTKLGKIAARSVALTTTAPSIARAWAEEQGRVVPEHGRNILELLGTRPGRVFLDLVQTLASKRQRIVLDILASTANGYATMQRLTDVQSEDNAEVLGDGKRDRAKVRRKFLGKVLFANTAGVFISSQIKRQ